MRAIRSLSIAAAVCVAGLGTIPGHARASNAAAPHKTIKAVNVDPNNGIYAWTPKKLTIKVGTRVIWSNPSDTAHNVTSMTKGWNFTKDLEQSATVSHTFKKAGVYHYACTLHQAMTGKIIVKS